MKNQRQKSAAGLLLALSLLCLSGRAFALGLMQSGVPLWATTVAIPDFTECSPTGEATLTRDLGQAVVQAFQVDGRLAVVPEKKADILIHGRIVLFQTLVTQLDPNQQPLQLMLKMVAELDVLDNRHHRMLWTTRRLVPLASGAPVLPPCNFDSQDSFDPTATVTYWTVNSQGHAAGNRSGALLDLENNMAQQVLKAVFAGKI